MKFITTVEQIDPHSGEVPNFQEWVRIRHRRVKWFEYARRRFDLVPLADVADWYAGPVEINADKRAAALKALLKSILQGEFGDGDWPVIAYLPQIIPIDRIGNFPLRLSVAHISHLCARQSTIWIDDLWAPRDRVAAWCAARDIKPPWLKPTGQSSAPHDAAPDRTIETIPEPSIERPKNRGGRPPKWDWGAFNREIVRLANSPDGLPDRATLMHHMLDWCSSTWGDSSPGESTVRQHISELYPE